MTKTGKDICYAAARESLKFHREFGPGIFSKYMFRVCGVSICQFMKEENIPITANYLSLLEQLPFLERLSQNNEYPRYKIKEQK